MLHWKPVSLMLATTLICDLRERTRQTKEAERNRMIANYFTNSYIDQIAQSILCSKIDIWLSVLVFFNEYSACII